MTTAIASGRFFAGFPAVTRLPSPRGVAHVGGGQSVSKQRLATDSLGNFSLTLTNLVVGSAIRVETQSGTLIEYRVADAATEVFTVPAYAVGSSANDLRIKVRKGTSAPFYQPYETLTTASVGSASIYVSQIPD